MVEFDRSRRKESSSNLEKNNDTSYGQTWRFSPPFEPCMIYWEVITATKDRNAYFNNFKFVSNVNVVNMRFGSSGNQREREKKRKSCMPKRFCPSGSVCCCFGLQWSDRKLSVVECHDQPAPQYNAVWCTVVPR